MAEVVIDNVYKTFPRQAADAKSATVLTRIYLDVKDREYMVLVGPSGCGKSTLLRLIAGLESITGGTITIGAQRVNALAPKQRDVAMVFQSYALYPHLSVYDNLAFGLRRTKLAPNDNANANRFNGLLTGLTRKLPQPLRYQSPTENALAQRVHSVAKMLQIEDLLNRLPKQLSGGQKQRIAIARALLARPRVLICDEPTSALDVSIQAQILNLLKDLQERFGLTILFISHNLAVVRQMSDDITVLKSGQVVEAGASEDFFKSPRAAYSQELLALTPNVMAA